MFTFAELSPIAQAFVAGCFTWLATALGASVVFLARDVNRRLLDAMLGFASGVMIAASYWSLLAPAVALSQEMYATSWFAPTVGFLSGALFLFVFDRVLPHVHLGFPTEEAEGPRTRWRRATLLVTAITLHNIPEGLAIGVAFGAAAADLPSATFASALALAVGIGLQNFPEGLAIAAPLRGEGVSPFRSFWYGQLSAVVEPIAAVIGAATVLSARGLLPYALSFAAGAMIFVVVEETIPESQRGGNTDLATLGAILGFAVMMVLDLAFS